MNILYIFHFASYSFPEMTLYTHGQLNTPDQCTIIVYGFPGIGMACFIFIYKQFVTF